MCAKQRMQQFWRGQVPHLFIGNDDEIVASVINNGHSAYFPFKPVWVGPDGYACARLVAPPHRCQQSFLPPGSASLSIRQDHIEISLAICATGIARGQYIKWFVARAKLPDIGQHLLDIIRLHELIWVLERADTIPARCAPKRFLRGPDAGYPDGNARVLAWLREQKRIVKLVMLPGVVHRLA